jgi:SRSO17 transposase
MFVRPIYIKSKGKRLAYWALVESYRTANGPRQRIVSYLGKLKETKRKGIKQAAEDKPGWIQTQLFDGDNTLKAEWIEINANGVRVENEKAFGGPWLAMELIKLLGLDDFMKQHILPGEEQVPWSLTSLILVICRLLNPSSELHIAEHYYKSTALSDLLGVPDERINDDRLYRGLDKLLPHKDKLETYLKNKLGTLFNLDFDILLYDVTSTYFEGQCHANPLAQHGHSRDHRSDCKQVCIGLVVTKEGIPLGYEVFAGNTHDSKTYQGIICKMEAKYGKVILLCHLILTFLNFFVINTLRLSKCCFLCMGAAMKERYTIANESILEGCLVTPDVYKGILKRFDHFVAPFIRHLHKRVQQHKAIDYMKGLMSDAERKNVESIAYYHGNDRQPLQKFIGQVDWDDEIILNKLVHRVVREIGTPNGILVLDPTSFPKKGTKSVGVQRQWCGRLGKVDNCQVATFLAYVGSNEFALVDRRLYLPKEWTDDPERCRIAGVPEEHIVEKTRHEQSLEMLKGRGKKLPHSWVAGDDEMGRIPWFRKALRKMKESYLLAVPSNILICDLDCKKKTDADIFISVQKWMQSLPAERWKMIKVRQGHKGWLTLRLVTCRVLAMIEGEVGDEETLIVSKWRDDTNKPRCDYYLSYSNECHVDLDEYGRVIKSAYRIEESFRRAKSECGLADYQVRNWIGWHHHVALSMLSQWFLTEELLTQKKLYR